MAGAMRAQVADYQQAAGDHAALFQGLLLTQTSFPGNSSPYLPDAEFRRGEVCFGGLVYHDVALRYDAFAHRLEVTTPERRLVVLPDASRIEWFTLDGQRYEPCQGRFAQVVRRGQGVELLCLVSKERDTEHIRDDRIVRRLKQVEEYLVRDGRGLHPVGKLKDLCRLYPQQAQELGLYAGEQHLSFRRKHRRQSLAACTHLIDSLLPAPTAPAAHRVAQAPTVALPDSLRQTLSEALPAYEAYRPGGTGRPRDDGQAPLTSNNGISHLKPLTEDRMLPEVEVSAFQSKTTAPQMGMEKFRPAQLRNVPMAFGEADVMKMMQTLPGVKTMGEASSGFNVRGGAADQNLVLMGGNTIYNPMHMFGLFSAFNSEVINDAELYKSSIPAEYGGRVSSVMNMSARTADKQHWHGSVSLGLLTSKVALELPIVKNRLSLLLAARTSYSDWMLRMADKSSSYRDGKAGFYDLNACLSWTLSPRHFLKAFGYYSHDRFSFTSADKHAYANANGSLEWRAFWTDRLSSTIVAGTDHYDNRRDDTALEYEAARLKSRIEGRFLRGTFALASAERFTTKLGWNLLHYDLRPGEMEPLGATSYASADKLPPQRALEAALFCEEEWKATDRLTLDFGLRLSLFSSFQREKEKTYAAPEVRFSGSYALNDRSSLKLGLNTMHQYIHKVSNTVIMAPTDTWMLSNAALKPQRGAQVAAGYYTWLFDHRCELSGEVYYKRMADYLTYRSGARLVMNRRIEDDVVSTQGQAYGLEVQLRKPSGKLNGWVSYSFSRTFLRQHGSQVVLPVNGGEWYPAEHDRPHELKFVGNYRFTRRVSVSLNVDYSTGRPTTLPAGKYYNSELQKVIPYYTKRNGYRMPDYFRMDFSMNVEPTHRRTAKTHSWLSLGVYNLTGRRNVYSIYYESQMDVQGYKLSIFGAPIPFVSYNIKF